MSYDDDTQPKASEKIGADELYELRKLKLLQEAKTELTTWAKQRAMVVTIALAIVGTIGLNVLVASAVRSYLADDIKEAQRASVLATESSRQAREAMDGATASARTYMQRLNELNAQAESIETSFKKLQADLEGSGRSIREETRATGKDLAAEIEALGKTVEKLLEHSSITEGEVNRLKEDFTIRQNTAVLQRGKFEVNSKNKIQLLTDDGSESQLLQIIRKRLESEGYVTQVFSGSLEYHEKAYGLSAGTLISVRSMTVLHNERSRTKAREIATLLSTIAGVEETEFMIDMRSSGPTSFGLFFPPED